MQRITEKKKNRFFGVFVLFFFQKKIKANLFDNSASKRTKKNKTTHT